MILHSRWLHAKTPVHVRNGLVTARHPLAAEAGGAAGCGVTTAGGTPGGRGPTVADVGQEQTAHVCAVDSNGMMVSLTETILAAYGSMVTTPAGMLMNNAMFAFVPVSGYPNPVAPGHRPQSSMNPVVVVDCTGRPVLAAGTSGGRRISAAIVQVVAYVLDHGLRAQDAVATPRLDVVGDTVLLDDRLPDHTAAALERRGHRVEQAEEVFRNA